MKLIIISNKGGVMIVCLCAGVNDRTIRTAIDGGSKNVKAVGSCTGAGTHCGSCCTDLRRMLQEEERPVNAKGAPQPMVLRR